MKKLVGTALAAVGTLIAQAEIDFNAGADIRIRQEIMENIPGLPGGGRAGSSKAGKYNNWMRFRARAWGEVKGITESESTWRLYVRVADEPRWYCQPHTDKYAFPDELILDNLFLEAKGLFDGFLDFSIGRQDMLFLYGLDHIFVDGTPGDGSRTVYSDMVRVGLNFENGGRLDLFGLYNFDDSDIRWGTDEWKHRSLSGLGGAEPEMDDWGFGAIWNDKIADNVPYQVFLMQKNTEGYYHPTYGWRPWTQRELLGAKIMPKLDDEWSLQFEAMGQIGQTQNNETLCAASAYAGANWKSAREGMKPFAKVGYHFMSGDDDAATEDGGHNAWDPMWSRGATDSEMFLYGTLYGVGWWSNQHALRATVGVDLGKYHKVSATFCPIWAAAQDGLGGGDGYFKGFQTFLKYDFPLFTNEWRRNLYSPDRERGLEIFGHVMAEFFNPGDYYDAGKPAYFVRWQVEFRF